MFARSEWPTIALFLYLQLLDVLTTLTGFSLGAGEASPFVRLLIQWGPLAGIVASKVGAIALAVFCYATRRPHLLRWINFWYAALILWNIIGALRLLMAGA